MTATAPPLAPSDVDEVRAAIREASGRRAALRIAGRGHWLDAGRPVRADAMLSLRHLSGITEYTPGDLTLTARAGTSLSEIERVTGAEGQWLTLDPFGADDGSLGATVATGSAGPLAQLYGTPRDLVLGLEFVSGRGEVARGGGRVVKNVAGFDLARLLTGSWGTLGAITEVTVRLRARPEVDETIALALPGTRELPGFVERVGAAPIAALALELVSAPLAARIGAGSGAVLLVRIAGNADVVRAQRGVLGQMGEIVGARQAVWGALRALEPAGAVVARLSTLPSRLPALWTAVAEACRTIPDALAHASVGRGLVRVVLPGDDLPALERVLLAGGERVTRIFERLPGPAWARVPGAVGGRLARGIRDAFDPDRLLNPGILGEDGS